VESFNALHPTRPETNARGTGQREERPVGHRRETIIPGMQHGAPKATLCPQPVRPYAQSPPSPGDGAAAARTEFAEDTELAELLISSGAGGGHMKMDIGGRGAAGCEGQAADRRPLSVVSTSAGATPSPEDRGSPQMWPQTPDSQHPVLSPHAAGARRGLAEDGSAGGLTLSGSAGSNRRGGNGAGGGASTDAISAAPSASGGGSSGRGRRESDPKKVFVGGIPQDITQDDLYNIFNEFGNVKKAWLQSHRAAGKTGISQSPPHNHRGFGFVIFSDKASVDKLLGRAASRFLHLPDTRRLEVKRAVASSELPGKPASAAGSPSQSRGGGSGGNPGNAGRGAGGGTPQSGIQNGRPREQMALVGMPSPMPMPTGSMVPMHTSAGHPWAASAVHPWAAQVGYPAPVSASHAMAMGHPGAHMLPQGQSMVTAPVPYARGYGAYPHTMTAMAQHHPAQGVPHQGMMAGFQMLQGLQVMGPHGVVQQAPIYQAQQRQ